MLVRPAMIGLDTERPETITIGTNELIGTDPKQTSSRAGAIDGRAVEKRCDSSQMGRQSGKADR